MINTHLIPTGASAVADVMSFFGLPGGNTLETLINGHEEKRRAAARNLLVEELRGGFHGFVERGGEDQDEMLSVLLRFRRAAVEGVARDNLRLLAQIIIGLKKNRTLHDRSFGKWTAILDQLDRDQLLVIGSAYVLDRDTSLPPLGDDNRQFWSVFIRAMEPKGFDREELAVICATVAQVGLFKAASAWGGLAYDVTPRLRELGQLADLESMSHPASPDR